MKKTISILLVVLTLLSSFSLMTFAIAPANEIISCDNTVINENCMVGKHEFTQWQITSEATPFKAGTQKHICLYCDYSEEQSYSLTNPIEIIKWFVTKLFDILEDIFNSLTGMLGQA